MDRQIDVGDPRAVHSRIADGEAIVEVLRLVAEYDCYDAIWWRCDGEFAPVTFFVNCNDLFWWATADAEPLTSGDIPELQQAIADICKIDKYEASTGFLLWCARKRGMRPQRPAYPQNEQLWALFDACGPPRTDE
jgi:hypothetical protein